jgi:hypothetical protein
MPPTLTGRPCRLIFKDFKAGSGDLPLEGQEVRTQEAESAAPISQRHSLQAPAWAGGDGQQPAAWHAPCPYHCCRPATPAWPGAAGSTSTALGLPHGGGTVPCSCQPPASPAAAARQVAFDYVGYNESGAVIDSSYRLGRPASTRLGIKGLIPGALLLWRCCCGWLGAQAGAPTTPAWVCGCRV